MDKKPSLKIKTKWIDAQAVGVEALIAWVITFALLVYALSMEWW